MLQYLVILLDDASTSFCHYAVPKTDKRLMPLDTLKAGILFAMKENLSVQFVYPNYSLPNEYMEAIDSVDHYNIIPASIMDSSSDALVADGWEVDVFNPNRSLEKNFLLFLMTAIRKSVLYMFDT